MRQVRYPRKASLRQHAAEAGVAIAFLEKQELVLRDHVAEETEGEAHDAERTMRPA